MDKIKLHYSIRSGGDGSAHIQFMESEELAIWDQDNMDEGWGETCNGYVELSSKSRIILLEDIMTIDDMITSIYFCQEVLMGSREDTELISTQLIKIFYNIIRQGNLDIDDIVMKETVTSPWDTELSERMKKKWKKESSINPSYGRKDMMFIWITEELKYEYETRIGVK